MQENRFGHRLRRREVLKLIAAGTSVSALMAACSAQALRRHLDRCPRHSPPARLSPRAPQSAQHRLERRAAQPEPAQRRQSGAVDHVRIHLLHVVHVGSAEPDVRARPGRVMGHRP